MKVVLDSGEEAEALHIEGNVLTLISPRAYAPGSPIRFSASIEGEDKTFEGRTVGSKRRDEDLFQVRLRFVGLRRSDRELLQRTLG